MVRGNVHIMDIAGTDEFRLSVREIEVERASGQAAFVQDARHTRARDTVTANLRDRGGSLADLAILIVDIMQGFQPQTIESIKILKQYKTPFIIAANKIDSLDGWKSHKTNSFLASMAQQPDYITQRLDEKMYDLMGKISEYGFDSERFDKVQDFSKTIAIVHSGCTLVRAFVIPRRARATRPSRARHAPTSAVRPASADVWSRNRTPLAVGLHLAANAAG